MEAGSERDVAVIRGSGDTPVSSTAGMQPAGPPVKTSSKAGTPQSISFPSCWAELQALLPALSGSPPHPRPYTLAGAGQGRAWGAIAHTPNLQLLFQGSLGPPEAGLGSRVTGE